MKPGLSGGIQATAPSACPRSATGASPTMEESCEWEKSLISRFWGSPYDNHYFENQSFIQVVKQEAF